MNLKNKVVWLTGASSGIGEAFAREVIKTGCKLVLSARREHTLKNLCEDLSKINQSVFFYVLDIGDRKQVLEVGSRIAKEVGMVDVLIANAGTHVPTKVEEFNSESYEALTKVNYFGALNCIEAVLPLMLKRGDGHLVAVSSVAGYRGLPKAAAYGASKAALTHFMESLRFDLQNYNVRVTVVSPGFIRTPLTDKNDFPMPFLMEAEDAAKAMLRGIENEQLEVHFPRKFTYIMKFLRILPYSLYHRLIFNRVVQN
jgi:short-subunit dehydrogenase